MNQKAKREQFKQGYRNWDDNQDPVQLIIVILIIIATVVLFKGCGSSSQSYIKYQNNVCKCNSNNITLDGSNCKCGKNLQIIEEDML